MGNDNNYRFKAKDYTVKRIDEDKFELWFDETHLTTLTKDEAWPVMLGRVHPEDFLRKTRDDASKDVFGSNSD
jgi:hypothetical protein